MNITELLTDDAVLAEFGERLRRLRLDRELTQAALAERAGVAKRTVERMEGGRSAQMSSVVRILRALGALGGFDALVPPAGPRPMELLRRSGKRRQRASSRRSADADPGDSGAPQGTGWTWGEET